MIWDFRRLLGVKLFNKLTIAFIFTNLLCLSVYAENGVQSPSFQQVKQELWAFGPEAQLTDHQKKEPENTPSKKEAHVHHEAPEKIPEELSRALVKYSVEL